MLIVLFSVSFSYLTFPFLGNIYISFFHPAGSWLDFSQLAGLSMAYLFAIGFLTPILIAGASKWVYILLAIPAVVFEIVSDPFHIYFPFVFGFIGLGLGLLARRLYTRYSAR